MWEITSTQHHDIQPPTPSTAINYRIKNEKPGRTRGREAGKRWSREAGEKMGTRGRGKVEKMGTRERRQRVREGDTMDPVFSRIEYLLSSQDKSQQQLLAARILPLFNFSRLYCCVY